MTYCENIQCTTYTTTDAPFREMVAALFAKLHGAKEIVRLIFFGLPADNIEYETQLSSLREMAKAHFGKKQPVVSYVCQLPLDGALSLEVYDYQLEAGETIAYKNYKEYPYVLLQNRAGRYLFAGGFQGIACNRSIRYQSKEAFQLIEELLELEQFPIENIVRQWNYIERITDFDGSEQRYQMFNNARSDFYQKALWTKGYPAATGIGMDLGGLLVDLDAVVLYDEAHKIVPIDNKLQVAAHAYSAEVLEEADNKKTTPKFERAKSIDMHEHRLIYISGTAAIRGEDSLRDMEIEEQTVVTMENIAQLIDDAPLVLLRVYLKEASFYAKAQEVLNRNYSHIPTLYTVADVCREELLIEIEGIAKK
ncbi:MAG: Rid family hydrolase [Phocaeicola sp.]